MSDPYAQLVIGGRNDQMTQKLKKRHFKQKKDYAAWVKQMRAQGYIVDATQTAYKETKDGELDEVMSYNQFKAGKKLENQTALKGTRTLLDSQKVTAKTAEKLKDGGANLKDLTKANAVYDRDSDDPKGAVPFDIAGKLGLSIGEGTLVGDKLISSGTNFSQTASKGDAEFQTDVESPTEGAAKESLEKLKIKSDVHTIDPETGEAVGVLTRSQRKAFEARDDVRRELLKAQKNKNDLRIYKNRTAGG